ncbi:DUF3857 domain-containing protein [Mucilaginibacter myungsuensis]|uniref:DUF3857 domain-containing protein n=1 Tax=Mucilaginibacter myungsuensis TaxID=649104 RepID=A0A929L0L1_9SPHI|nr:DUF3857 domain-containing protein [Mucilaginibacter myungsuensis]MBE9663383.1 DUF3857 domain-containing protein [Mucilaginibacter myungsuensis]MDN3600120.1 DUF3857 domain-containing protein [Mucilaginibacter myungsuensis]
MQMITLRKALITAACLLIGSIGYGQDKSIPKEYYDAGTLPAELKTDAHAVIRYSADDIFVKGPGSQTVKHHSIITVLDQKGDDAGEMVMFYNRKFDTYSNIEIKVYGATGQLLKKYKKSDMYERSAVNDETIVTDDRLLAIQHTIPSYPTTIELVYEENITSYINLNSWMIRPKADVSVQLATCKVTVDPAAGFRYQAQNIAVQPHKDTQGSSKMETYFWEVKDLKANKPEENTLPWQMQQKVSFAINNFEYYGTGGAMDSWQNFGKWIAKLNGDANVLPPARVEAIKKMTDTIKSDKDKARFLYNYVQQNMRYVSIQLGIGGLKPFPATFVDQKKYGDCKALTNYMNALLKAVDIPSYYAIINAGTNAKPADLDFPSNVFNHVILCIPFKNDTTWLECTSSTQPFGKLGTFTENRRALLITEDGGKLVSTPKSAIEDNVFDSFANVSLKPDGSAVAKLKLLSTGEYRSLYTGMESIKMDERKEYLLRSLNIKQPIVFDLKPSVDKLGVKEMNLELLYDKFCDMKVGDKQFLKPAAFDLWHNTFPELTERKNDFYFEHPMKKTCLTTIDLPEGYEVESLPAEVKLKFSHGNYDVSYKYDKDKNQVIASSAFKLSEQVIPAAKYAEMQQYMEEIARSQSKKLVIKRKA